MRQAMLLAIGLLLGCTAPGIKEGTSLSAEVATSMDYQAAYRFADAYARKCHVDPIGIVQRAFPISGNIFPDNKTAIVRVQAAVNTANDFQRFEIRENHANSSTVRVTVANQSVFKQDELEYAIRAIRTGKIACLRAK